MAKASKARAAWLTDPDAMDYGLGTMPQQTNIAQPWSGVGHTPGTSGQNNAQAEQSPTQVPMRVSGLAKPEQSHPAGVQRPRFTRPMQSKKTGVQRPGGTGAGPGTGTGQGE